MDIKRIKKELEEFLLTKNLHLFDCSFNKHEKIFSILIDESLNMEELEIISNELSNFMDKYDDEFYNYILDVSNVGIERPIRNDEEIKKAIGSFIYIKTKDKEYNGFLDEFDGNELVLSYKDKTRDKVVKMNKKDIKNIRYAVNFKGEE